ncbi:MAG TPA: FtsX-like permease family protein [Bacillota bacterium]|nr:FtsX-like permease family protein [Bacillota bacterium]
MFLTVFRKMLNNKWMTLCIILGAVVTVAMFSSIQIYTGGVLQKMLTRELELSQAASGAFPGGYLVEFSQSREDETKKTLKRLDQKIIEMSKNIALPLITRCKHLNAGTYTTSRNELNRESNMIDIVALTGIQDHIKIKYGRMCSPILSDDVYEVIVPETAMKVLGLTLGNTYELSDVDVVKLDDEPRKFRVKVIGVFNYRTNRDPYWFYDLDQYQQSMFMDQNLLKNTFLVKERIGVNSANWLFAYDYHQISLVWAPQLLKTIAVHIDLLAEYAATLTFPAATTLEEYQVKEKELKLFLLILQIPVLILLAFYSFMVSELKIDFESNEIAVIKSRGASGWQIFAIYLMESSIIGCIALLLGPLLGFFLCKILGASNGFLEFVERSAVPSSLNTQVYLYSLIIIGFISISMLLPAISASRTGIVLYKQKKARPKRIFWKQYFLDVALLTVSFYGLFNFHRYQQTLFLSELKGTELSIDPLLFLISSTFIFGSGLLFLRIYPHLIRLVFWLGKRTWSPVYYASFIQVGRSSGQEQFVMLLVILTLSIGIFSANSARTVNQNTEDKIRYAIGADIVVESPWPNNKIPNWFKATKAGPPTAMPSEPPEIRYVEPPFEPFTKLKGVASVTKVLRTDNTRVFVKGNFMDNIPLIGIVPHEFGKTAWFRDDLLPYHWYQYLNLMTAAPKAVLVSKAFRETLGLKEGDWISFSLEQRQPIYAVIYAFIDYWPTLNSHSTAPYFVVANLDYIFKMNPVTPYQVWLKKKPGATSNQVYQDLLRQKIDLDSRTDATEELIKQKNDPLLLGANGALTLNFMVTMMVSIIGFLIFWILSIKKRTLQFGIFRAIGLSMPKITGMLVCEQFLITGAAIGAGIIIGNLTGRIFIPLLQMAYSAEEQVPPLKIITNPGDYLRLYLIVALMLTVGLIVLWRIVKRINISQALKLGED